MVEGKGPANLVGILFANIDIDVDVGVEIVLSLL
jgi:hypothetical protein